MKAILVYQGCVVALEGANQLHVTMIDDAKNFILEKKHTV